MAEELGMTGERGVGNGLALYCSSDVQETALIHIRTTNTIWVLVSSYTENEIHC
jgi:hypothetical protein